MSKNIPTKVNNYNVYNEGEKLLGVGDELTLPDFAASFGRAVSESLVPRVMAAARQIPPSAISAICSWRSLSAPWTKRPPT